MKPQNLILSLALAPAALAQLSQTGTELSLHGAGIGTMAGQSVSTNGLRIVTGAPLWNGMRGAAWVHARSGTGWGGEAALTAPDGLSGDQLGRSVALERDGLILAVGAPGKDQFRGSTYVFVPTPRRINAFDPAWTLVAKLRGSDTAPNDGFGSSVACAGNRIAVGATGHGGRGAVYVFRATSGGFLQEAKISVGLSGDGFGWSVALDGETLVVGAPRADTTVADQGAVYVFRSSSGIWKQEAKLTGKYPATGLGFSVSLSGDGLVAGAPGAHWSETMFGQAAFVFRRTSVGWLMEAHLRGNSLNDFYGNTVAISGSLVLVGAGGRYAEVGQNLVKTGACFLYRRDGSSWTLQSQVLAADRALGDGFGSGVCLYRKTAAIGAPGADGNRGTTYVLEIP